MNTVQNNENEHDRPVLSFHSKTFNIFITLISDDSFVGCLTEKKHSHLRIHEFQGIYERTANEMELVFLLTDTNALGHGIFGGAFHGAISFTGDEDILLLRWLSEGESSQAKKDVSIFQMWLTSQSSITKNTFLSVADIQSN
jgi:hypothetical protein